MKDIRYNISLYIIIPLIFSGFSALGMLAAYRLTRFYLDRGLRPEWPLAFWGLLLVLCTFFGGLLVVKFLIDPVKKFVGQTKTLGLVRNIAPSRAVPAAGADMQHYTQVFDQVSVLLSKVEARELFPDIIGQSKTMRGIFNQIMKVAAADSTVLILGETGTGKELIANSIHAHSQRQGKPFVAINCAAIPEGLLESELFGHEKGAFTGANSRKPGKFETADGGTLFLDEIGDMPLETQAKVLRALEENQIARLGSVKSQKINLRFITATNKNLSQMVHEGRFRQDLFYRLNGFGIHLPPLRERREDIPLLAEYFLQKRKNSVKQISSASMQMLMAYDWPGNVRELQHAVESAAVMADQIIEPVHLPSVVTQDWGAQLTRITTPSPSSVLSIDERLKEIEKNIIIEALNQSQGVQIQAAKILGIKERSLWHRLKKYEIDASVFKNR